MSDCNMVTSINFNNYSSGGGWANSGGGNYPPNGSYGGGNSGNNNTKPIPDPVPEILPTREFLANPKLKCIWQKLNNILVNNNSTLLTSLFAEFSGVTYDPQDISIYLVDDIITDDGKRAYGTCQEFGDDYLINLNKKTLDYRAPIEIAYTIIHEMLHAHLWRQYKTSNENFTELFAKYVAIRHGVKDLSHHEIMRKYYIQTLANTLKKFDATSGVVNPDYIYTNLAWSGLHTVLPAAEQQKIIDAKNYVRNNGVDCN